MLPQLAKIVEKKPYAVILAVTLITIIFSLFIPIMESGTNMEDFLPDNEVVRANQKVLEYFGESYEVLMVYVKDKNVTQPQAIKEQKLIAEKLSKKRFVEGVISLPFFLEHVCYMEYGKDIDHCSYQEISDAFKDVMSEKKSIILLAEPDPRESNIPAFADIKNAYLREDNSSLIFTIEVQDLSNLDIKELPGLSNSIEWSISFENRFIPDKMKMSYKISARLEPKSVWILGEGYLQNLRHITTNLDLKRNLNHYERNVYLWIKPPRKNIYIPIKLKNSTFDIDLERNRIIINVSRDELKSFGIAPKFGNMELPAKLEKMRIETRFYGLSRFNLPWFRLSVDSSFLSKMEKWFESRKLLKTLYEKVLERFNISIEDASKFTQYTDKNYTLSLLDVDKNWKTLDIAPNRGYSKETFLLKPEFMKDLKESILSFLPKNGYDSTLMIIQINGTISRESLKELSKEIGDLLREESKGKSISFEVTGSGIISYQIDKLTSKSNSIIAPGIFVAIMLILFLNFKRPSYVFLPLLGLGISIIWLFGTMSILHMKFNTIAVALVPLIMGLGVDYSVHMFHNYRAEISKGSTPAKAIASSIRDVGTAMFLATITTCISFLSFLTSSVPPVRDFGILCALGITYTFIVTISLQASLRYILDRRKPKSKLKVENHSLKITMEGMARRICKYGKGILLAALFVTIVMIYFASNVETGFSMEEFLPEDAPAIKTMEKISEKFPSASQDQEYILVEGDIANVNVLRDIRNTLLNIQDDTSVARNPDGSPRVESIISIIDEAVRYNKSIAEKFNLDANNIPRSNSEAKALLDYLYNSPEYGRETRSVLYKENNRFKAALIRVYVSSEISNRSEILYKELNKDIEKFDNAKATVTGTQSLIYTITKSLRESQINSTIVCLVLASIILILAYRSIALGLASMIPVILSSIWILGTMYLAGYTLNVMTVMVTSLTIGLGVTYAIHAVERYRLVMRRDGDVEKAVFETISHTGGAILASAITTIAGFGILILSPLPPEQQFGIITAMSIFYALVTTIVVLPPVLYIYGKWREIRDRSSGH